MKDKLKLKVRRSWGDLKPVTKRIESDKIYKRSRNKYNFNDYSWGDLN